MNYPAKLIRGIGSPRLCRRHCRRLFPKKSGLWGAGWRLAMSAGQSRSESLPACRNPLAFPLCVLSLYTNRRFCKTFLHTFQNLNSNTFAPSWTHKPHRNMRLYSTAAVLAIVLLSGEGIEAQKLRTTGGKDLVGVHVTAQGTNSVQIVPAISKAAEGAGEKRQYRGKGRQGKDEGCLKERALWECDQQARLTHPPCLPPPLSYKCTGVNLGGWLVSKKDGREELGSVI